MRDPDRPLIAPMDAEQRRVQAAFSNQVLEAAIDAVERLLRDPSGPGAIHAVIENVVGFAEAMTSKLRHPESPPVACQAGCSWCCHQTIPVSAPEVFRIARFMTNAVPGEVRESQLDGLRKLDRETHGATSTTRVRLRLPCAFLHEHQCTVYPVRPLACAEFTSYSVEDCKRGQRFGFKFGSVTHEKARMIVYHAVQRGLFVGLERALPKADADVLELTAAVLAVLDAPNAESEWLNGGTVFARTHLAIGPEDA
jgi:Fe-S-cluster containining protein